MALIFLRHYPPSVWNPRELSGPCPYLTLREWEVGVVLCSLPPALNKALAARLTAPSAHEQPRPSGKAADQRAPFAAGEPREPRETRRERFRDEIKAIRRTLDMPLAALHGISRDTLLVAHGARLRQLSAALGEPLALREVAAMTEPEAQEPPRPAAHLSRRWGGRWAAFFDGAGML